MHLGPVIGSTKVGFMMDHNEVLVLAGRIRAALAAGHVTEKRMFGGVTFLVNGNMLCCASKQGLMVRVGRDAEAAALSLPFARPCLGTGRHMTGFVMVERAGISDAEILSRWLDIARAYVERLPPKTANAEV
jgi:TfoX/Sxy family transcriptional regulator of competence genes